MKVFWSWQSDTPGKIGRHFVRDALSVAIEQLKQTPEIEEPTAREARSAMHLDQDRKGIPGSPDLARVILEKIEQSAVFVADVTSVGITTTQKDETQPKKVINPNVAIELGYALHALGDRAFLMVMNEHYGSRADLPFDLQSKAGPIMFRLPPDADRKTITAASRQLTAQLAEALELCIAQHVERTRQQTLFPEAPAAGNPAMYFQPNEVLANAGYPGEQQFQFPYERAAYIRLFPAYQSPRVGLAKLVPVFEARKPCPMSMTIGGIPGRNRFGPIILDPRGPNTIEGLTQGFETGELWGVNGIIFVQQMLRDFRSGYQQVPVWVIPTITFEKLYVRVLMNYVKVMSELKLDPPYTLELGVVGLKDAYLTISGLHERGAFKGPVLQDMFKRRDTLRATTVGDIKNVLRTFFEELYDLAAFARADAFSDNVIAAHGLPPL
jgi:hypothetical protein